MVLKITIELGKYSHLKYPKVSKKRIKKRNTSLKLINAKNRDLIQRIESNNKNMGLIWGVEFNTKSMSLIERKRTQYKK